MSSSIKNMIRIARLHYPNSKAMRKQWVRKTLELITGGKHASKTGGWVREGFK